MAINYVTASPAAQAGGFSYGVNKNIQWFFSKCLIFHLWLILLLNSHKVTFIHLRREIHQARSPLGSKLQDTASERGTAPTVSSISRMTTNLCSPDLWPQFPGCPVRKQKGALLSAHPTLPLAVSRVAWATGLFPWELPDI